MQPSSNILALTGISKAFAGVKALDRVNFDLRPGEVHALVGENGAGKSTLMKVLTGVYQRDAGQIAIEGRPVEIRDVHHARQLGVAIIFQELSQVPQLTVAQNIFLGEEPRRFLGVLNDRRMTARAADLLHTYQIHLDPSEQLSGLSAAERQLAEIAKAISLGARILIMDEPTSALTLGETENLFKIVNHLRQQGVGIIYISHRMNEIARLADRVTVLRDGKNVGTFDAAAISSDEIVRLMVGREVEAVDAATHQRDAWRRWATEEPALDVCGLSRKGVLSDITFSLRRGEILGLAGLVGSGRSEVARAIFGIDPIDQGEIRMGGKPVRIRNAGDAMAAGMALLPEDRRQQGLITRHTVEQNLMLPILPAYTRHGMVNGGACRRAAQKAIEHLQIRPSDPTRIVQFLSGGNQQKVVLAKWLAANPQLFIMDEPTAGIDVAAKADIHQLVRGLAATGVGILLISSDMPEIINLSDRILVMHEGKIRGEFTHDEVTQEKIMIKIMASVETREGNC